MDADEAVADLVRSSAGRLLRFAFQLCHDRATAEDLVQAGLERVYRRWKSHGPVDSPEAYARRVVLNEFLGRRRRASAGEVSMAEVPDRAISDSAEGIVAGTPLWLALEKLPGRQRAALVLRYYEGVPDAEIATLLGCRESTVRTLVARGLAQLRLSFATVEPDLR